MKLKTLDGQEVGCIQSGVTNGKTLQVPAVSYVAAGIAGVALILSGLTAFGNAGTVGNHAPSLGFTTIFGWFQTMQMNGMHSVNYPGVYRSFSKNFAFSGGLIPWTQMQTSIDNFRASTGGNLTNDNVQFLQNSTLAFNDGSSNTTTFDRRSVLDFVVERTLYFRDVSTSTNGTNSSSSDSKLTNIVHGISGYVEELTIPQANTFMTVLLIFAIVIAAITVAILLFKVILEAWALFGSFPKRLTSFRKRYWHTLAKTIVNLILLLYGVWVLYCIFQFTNGDSWAAKVLAGVTLATFTAILAFFVVKIWIIAHKYKRAEGDTAALYENKETWIKYSQFYDSYKRGYWWLFMPAIIYMFAKGCVLAAGDGHGLTQTSGQLIIESLMFILLLWTRPYATKAGNWINIVIQVVRVISVICILVFVEELGIAQTTQTITGVVLVAVQAGLTGILAILIAINAVIVCVRQNPHRRRRKENGIFPDYSIISHSLMFIEKLNREFDNLTPLDARNSLLIAPVERKDVSPGFSMAPYNNRSPYTPVPNPANRTSSEALVGNAAGMGETRPSTGRMSDENHGETHDPLAGRQPTFPIIGFQNGYSGRRVL